MESLKEWARKNKLLESSTIYGIAHDGPEISPENCQYDVCLVTETDWRNGNTVQSGYISGGKYAVFTVSHTAQAVQEFWQNIFAELQQNNLLFDSARPILERYKYDMVKSGECEFCVPIVKEQQYHAEWSKKG